MHLARHIPAWILTRLPVQQARQFSHEIDISPATVAETGKKSYQILVDVSVIHQSDARTGIQRVVRALLLQLLYAPPKGYCIRPVFATAKHGYCYAATDFLQAQKQPKDAAVSPVQVQRGDLFLALDLAAHLLPRHQAQVLGWKRAGVQLHVLVYDLLPLLHPEWFNPRTTRNFGRWVRWLAIYADSAICISQSVKVELLTWLKANFGLSPTVLPASTIVLGADIDASSPSVGLPVDSNALLDRVYSAPSVLMVGTLEPRKGYDEAIAAFENIWQNSQPAPLLIIVGRAGWKTEKLQDKLRNHPENGRRFLWLDAVSDEYLSQLYKACSGVMIASRAEGFGLPLIEALQHHKPVLARDIPVFRELEAHGVNYFRSEKSSDLADAIIHWMSTISSPPALRAPEDSMPRFPTWQLAATQLLQALNLKSQALQPGAARAAEETMDFSPARIALGGKA